MKRTAVGVIGCGNVSDIYMRNLGNLFPQLCVTACASRRKKSAEKLAEKYKIPKVCSTEELLEDSKVEVVLNLTTPDAHYEITKKALNKGKHVYSEKPVCLEMEQARELQALTGEKRLRLGCAPDTVLGAAVQTGRKILDEGVIGSPLSASVFFGWHGPEHEHPNPAFLYQYGAGPVFDYGPYYFSALVTLLGPVEMVSAMASRGFKERICTCPGPHFGERFPVETPTHVTGTIRFQSGVLASVTISFDIWGHSHPFIEIYGTEGSLRLPDPDRFGGDVLLLKKGEDQFRKIPLVPGYEENARGLGLADMVRSIRENQPHRASDTMAVHVLEIMHAFLSSSRRERPVILQTDCERPRIM
ncbi:MAG: Gfo/Idh/MocA family protein [Ruminococcus sp.]|jgi:predicted dehydrogenase